jgi:hypothetical protein
MTPYRGGPPAIPPAPDEPSMRRHIFALALAVPAVAVLSAFDDLAWPWRPLASFVATILLVVGLRRLQDWGITEGRAMQHREWLAAFGPADYVAAEAGDVRVLRLDPVVVPAPTGDAEALKAAWAMADPKRMAALRESADRHAIMRPDNPFATGPCPCENCRLWRSVSPDTPIDVADGVRRAQAEAIVRVADTCARAVGKRVDDPQQARRDWDELLEATRDEHEVGKSGKGGQRA